MDVEDKSFPEASRLAIMGCSYGNVPALSACIQDARERGCDRFVFLGDAIGCCGHSNEMIDLVEREFDACLAGNLEQQAVEEASGCGCGYTSESDEAISGRAFRYALNQLDEQHREAITSWPDLLRVEIRDRHILCCHGSPRRTNEFLYKSEISDKPWKSWCDEQDVQGIVCAHTGFPWTDQQEGLAVGNCGASGKPDHDGDPAVHYLLLEVRSNPPGMRICRVEYDAEKWVEQLTEEGVDEVYRQPLLTGQWTYGLSQVPEPELNERDASRAGRTD